MYLGNIDIIYKLSDALLSFYESKDEKRSILMQTERLIDYLQKEKEICDFFRGFGFEKSSKKEVIEKLKEALQLDDFLINTLYIMVDKYLIFKIELFLSTLRSKILNILNIKNIYVYSSFPINKDQSEKIERLWKDRLNKECNFYYAIDKSLKLGIKIQVDMYIEEYSLSSSLNNLKIKLDSLLVY